MACKSSSLMPLPNKDSIEDCMCTICLSILIYPVTLPCGHELCMPCFEQTIEEASMTCPLCRVRISTWARRASKSNTLINQKRWEQIQRLFPIKVQRRLNGQDDEEINLSYRQMVQLSKPGEIRKEYEAELRKLAEQQREEKLKEEEASAALIHNLRNVDEHISEENRRRNEEIATQDAQLAKELGQLINKAESDSETPKLLQEAKRYSVTANTSSTGFSRSNSSTPSSKASHSSTEMGKSLPTHCQVKNNKTLEVFFRRVPPGGADDRQAARSNSLSRGSCESGVIEHNRALFAASSSVKPCDGTRPDSVPISNKENLPEKLPPSSRECPNVSEFYEEVELGEVYSKRAVTHTRAGLLRDPHSRLGNVREQNSAGNADTCRLKDNVREHYIDGIVEEIEIGDTFAKVNGQRKIVANAKTFSGHRKRAASAEAVEQSCSKRSNFSAQSNLLRRPHSAETIEICDSESKSSIWPVDTDSAVTVDTDSAVTVYSISSNSDIVCDHLDIGVAENTESGVDVNENKPHFRPIHASPKTPPRHNLISVPMEPCVVRIPPQILNNTGKFSSSAFSRFEGNRELASLKPTDMGLTKSKAAETASTETELNDCALSNRKVSTRCNQNVLKLGMSRARSASPERPQTPTVTRSRALFDEGKKSPYSRPSLTEFRMTTVQHLPTEESMAELMETELGLKESVKNQAVPNDHKRDILEEGFGSKSLSSQRREGQASGTCSSVAILSDHISFTREDLVLNLSLGHSPEPSTSFNPILSTSREPSIPLKPIPPTSPKPSTSFNRIPSTSPEPSTSFKPICSTTSPEPSTSFNPIPPTSPEPSTSFNLIPSTSLSSTFSRPLGIFNSETVPPWTENLYTEVKGKGKRLAKKHPNSIISSRNGPKMSGGSQVLRAPTKAASSNQTKCGVQWQAERFERGINSEQPCCKNHHSITVEQVTPRKNPKRMNSKTMRVANKYVDSETGADEKFPSGVDKEPAMTFLDSGTCGEMMQDPRLLLLVEEGKNLDLKVLRVNSERSNADKRKEDEKVNSQVSQCRHSGVSATEKTSQKKCASIRTEKKLHRRVRVVAAVKRTKDACSKKSKLATIAVSKTLPNPTESSGSTSKSFSPRRSSNKMDPRKKLYPQRSIRDWLSSTQIQTSVATKHVRVATKHVRENIHKAAQNKKRLIIRRQKNKVKTVVLDFESSTELSATSTTSSSSSVQVSPGKRARVRKLSSKYDDFEHSLKLNQFHANNASEMNESTPESTPTKSRKRKSSPWEINLSQNTNVSQITEISSRSFKEKIECTNTSTPASTPKKSKPTCAAGIQGAAEVAVMQPLSSATCQSNPESSLKKSRTPKSKLTDSLNRGSPSKARKSGPSSQDVTPTKTGSPAKARKCGSPSQDVTPTKTGSPARAQVRSSATSNRATIKIDRAGDSTGSQKSANASLGKSSDFDIFSEEVDVEQGDLTQEGKDYLLALKLQQQCDLADRLNLTVMRFKGSNDEYSLRQSQQTSAKK